MQKISDLIEVNERATLVKGVQLEWYQDPSLQEENTKLALGYMFSSGRARQGALSAISLFERIKDSLTQTSKPSIFTIIAHYGHGKSHFALVLANYFGRSSKDPILQGLIEQIEKCSSENEDTASSFKTFKENSKKPQLVVCLSGHNFTDLRQGFLRALRRSLDGFSETKDYPIKAVSAKAVKWLKSLNSEKREAATNYLEENDYPELETLIADLENFDISKEIIIKDLSEAILGVKADFGADVNLREVIVQVVDELCVGENAPFDKMVILFDELGIYLEKWCENKILAGALAPQQILEACDDRRGQVCLATFLQREMTEFVKHYPNQEEFKKWAERFPNETSFRLETSLEKVIKSLIIKKSAWNTIITDLLPQIKSASDYSWQILPHYQNQQVINQQDFASIVGVGTYPLHPITTGLLCHLTFVQGGRTVISFVSETIKEIINNVVLENGKLNWVLPVILVDKFGNNFEGQSTRYFLYETALRKLGSNAEKNFYLFLKALFLFDVAKLKLITNTRHKRHLTVLSQLCGLPEDELERVVKKLEEEFYIIRFSREKEEYEFTGIGTSPLEIRQVIQKEIIGKTLTNISHELELLPVFKEIFLPESEATEFKADYGLEGEEWKLEPFFYDSEYLNINKAQQNFIENKKTRGIVIYAFSKDEESLHKATQNIPIIINSLIIEKYPCPIVIAHVKSSVDDLVQEVLIRKELNSWGAEKKKIYGEGYNATIKDSDRRIKDYLIAYIKNVKYYYSDVVGEKIRGTNKNRLESIADCLFKESFPFRVPAKSHIMKATNPTGNSVVAEIARYFLINNLNFNVLDQKTKNLISSVLTEGDDKWGILNSKYQLQEPTDKRVLESWQYLDRNATANEIMLDEVISKLSMVPYGHDDFTLTLLFAAWIGKNKSDLSFTGILDTKSRNKTQVNLKISDIQEQLKQAKGFIKWLQDSKLKVKKSNRTLAEKHVANYISRIEASKDYLEVKSLIEESFNIKKTLPEESELISKIDRTINAVKVELEKIEKYKALLGKFKEIIKNANLISDLLKLSSGLPTEPSTNFYFDKTDLDIKSIIEGKITQVTLAYEKLKIDKLEEYLPIISRIEKDRDALKDKGREDIAERCSNVITRLNNERNNLKNKQEEKTLLLRIESIKVSDIGLYNSREVLKEINHIIDNNVLLISTETIEKINNKRRSIIDNISKYEQWITELQHFAKSIDSLNNARVLRDDIISRERDYANTEELKTLINTKQFINNIISSLELEERQKNINEAEIKNYLVRLEESCARVHKTTKFEIAVEELETARLLAIPQNLTLSDSQKHQVTNLLDKAYSKVETLFHLLKQEEDFSNSEKYTQKLATLKLAIESLEIYKNYPVSWQLELNETLKSIENSFNNWKIKQENLQKQRDEEQKERLRKQRNSKRLENILKQTQKANTIYLIKTQKFNVEEIYSQLEPPCDEEINVLNAETKRLDEVATKIHNWVNELLPKLAVESWEKKAITNLREQIVHYELLCVGDELLTNELLKTKNTLDKRQALLNKIETLTRKLSSISSCNETLIQVDELKKEYPDCDILIISLEESIKKQLAYLHEQEQIKAKKWLNQFSSISIDEITLVQVNDLLHKLENIPQCLDNKDLEFINSIQRKIKSVLDKDIVSKIVIEFNKLSTLEQKVECFVKIAEICKRDIPTEKYIENLQIVFEHNDSYGD